MGFPHGLLDEGEDVVLDLHPHWRVLVAPVAAVVGATSAVALLGAREANQYLLLATGLAVLAGATWLLARSARRATTHVVVTTERVVLRSGVLRTLAVEIPLDRVTTVLAHQTLLERLVRSGELVVVSGGENGRQRLTDVPRPVAVQRQIHRQIEARRRAASARPGDTRSSVADRLEELDGLRQRGLITQTEFDAARSRVLEHL